MAGAGGMGGWNIEVTNLKQLMNALDGIDKSAAKRINKTATTAITSVEMFPGFLRVGGRRNLDLGWREFITCLLSYRRWNEKAKEQ